MRTFLKILLLLLFMTLLSYSASADEDDLRRDSLRNMAQRKRQQLAQEREQVRQFARERGVSVQRRLPDGTVIRMRRIVNGFPVFDYTLNFSAAITSSVNAVWPGGESELELTGDSETLGFWDAGAVRASHEEFDGRVIRKDDNAEFDFHATHVAGTMVAGGVEPDARGMAYEASLDAYDWDDDIAEMTDAAGDGMQVSNHSYGLVAGWFHNEAEDRWEWYGDPEVSETEDFRFGYYSDLSQSWDELAYNAPHYLIIKAAGNDRLNGPDEQPVAHYVVAEDDTVDDVARNLDGGPEGYASLAGRAVAKNVLTVGAVHGIDGGYEDPEDVEMSSFSSWGPTNDGRIKPDIVAQGKNVYSTLEETDNVYGILQGTSMATPVVSSSAGLLHQHYRNLYGEDEKPLASTVRALLVHTADHAGEEGPDYEFGWGLLNTLRAAEVMSEAAAENTASIREPLLNDGEIYNTHISSDGDSTIRVTIAWTDPPGEPVQPDADNVSPDDLMLVHDLDLRITGSDDVEYKPYILDPDNPSEPAVTGDNVRDNVEQVYIAEPEAGEYIISVAHKGSLQNGSQEFSLIISGAESFKETPEVEEWPTPSEITFGDTLADSHLAGGEAEVDGDFAWTDESIAPETGEHAFEVTFTPNDTDKYHTVTQDVEVTVQKAEPDVTQWPTAMEITYGDTLADSELLDGDANVDGVFDWAEDTIAPDAGEDQLFEVTFIPDDENNYMMVSEDVKLTVLRAEPNVTQWPTASDITYGDMLADSELDGGEADVEGDFEWTDDSTAPNAGDGQVHDVTFAPQDSDNYQNVASGINLDVNRKALTITANDKMKIYDKDDPAEDPEFTVSYDGFVLDDGPDDLDGELVLTREEAEGIGDYPIKFSGQTDLSSLNYDMTFFQGVLSIVGYIQNEIDKALDDPQIDIVEIEPGAYHGSITIAGPEAGGLTLRSTAGMNETFIDAECEAVALTIYADNVTVEGFTIGEFNTAGIHIKGYGTAVSNNVVDGWCALQNDKSGAAVWIDGAENTAVNENNIVDAETGVLVDGPAAGTFILSNDIKRNKDVGIACIGSPVDTWAAHNRITGNGWGVDWSSAGEDIKAVYNWWGHATGPENSDDPDAEGDSVSDNVEYEPWIRNDYVGSVAADGEPLEDINTGFYLEITGADGMVSITRTGGNPTPVEFVHDEATSFSHLFIAGKEGIQEIIIRIYYIEPSDRIVYWFDDDKWGKVSNQTPVETSAEAPEHFEGFDGYVELSIQSNTEPSLEDFSGVVFGVGSEYSPDDNGNGSSSIDCFVATAAFGTPDSPYVQVLRQFRDGYLLETRFGHVVVEYYYSVSPQLASLIRRQPILRMLSGVILLPAVALAYLLINGYWSVLISLLLCFVLSFLKIHVKINHKAQ